MIWSMEAMNCTFIGMVSKKVQRVLIVDDLLATGGTVDATIQIVKELGGEVVGCAFLIELAGLKGREHLKGF